MSLIMLQLFLLNQMIKRFIFYMSKEEAVNIMKNSNLKKVEH